MPATCLLPPLHTPTASLIITRNPNPKPTSSIFNAFPPSKKLGSYNHVSSSSSCRASSPSSSSSWVMDFDLYDLLGVGSFSDQSEIKAAYRMLQKRCHPDIAGPTGHDMAIILNEAYSLLSDPVLRRAYDKEQAKLAELKGYTGKPLYSVWYGSESEDRAVFVDEVKCVGCLKCALCAEKTFAIESVYGRARVVAQWADPETKIQEAIQACPVDCISMVERSDLASLEFLMSKQPRGNVRVGAGNTVGTRVSNVFVDVKKFQARYVEAIGKANRQSSKDKDLQQEARISAIQAIRSISNWLYWQFPGAKAPTSVSQLNNKRIAQDSVDPNIEKLRDAAAARKNGWINQARSTYVQRDEYWVPSAQALPSAENRHSSTGLKSEPLPMSRNKHSRKGDHGVRATRQDSAIWRIPFGTATLAALIVRLHAEDRMYEIKEHIGGSFALSIVDSPWLQVTLAGITWYFVGVAIAELVEAAQNKLRG